MIGRIFLFALAALLSLGVARSEAAEEGGGGWPAGCSALGAAMEDASRRVAARDCALAEERRLGPDHPDLIALYERIAETLAQGRGGVAAQAALPYRRRAHRTAQRLLGEQSFAAGAAALRYAQASILAGRCEAQDPRVIRLLDAAAAGMRAGAADARRVGLKDVAMGYADALLYARALTVMLEAGGPKGAQLRAEEWERVGLWRHRLRDAPGAAAAYRRALALAPPPQDRFRLRQSLKQALFEMGDLDGLEALARE